MSFQSMLTAGKAKATRIDIKRNALTSDGQGGYTRTWAILYRNVLCRFNALSATEMAVLADKKALYAQYYVFLEYISGLQESDRIINVDTNDEYEIKLIENWDQDNRMMKLAVSQLGRTNA